jgi:hypothetical protein
MGEVANIVGCRWAEEAHVCCGCAKEVFGLFRRSPVAVS